MSKSKSHKKWLAGLLASLALLLIALAVFNWAVDPLWCFGHPHWFTHMQKPFNERHQKTNHLTFVKDGYYDAVIVGNSRTSLINQNDFGGMRAYNYSVPGMTAYEFGDYLNYFRKRNGAPKTIIMGIDFDDTNDKLQFPTQRPDYYITTAESPLYRYKELFTYDTFRYSRENLTIDKFIKHNAHGGGAIIYNNDNVATLLPPLDEARRQEYIKREIGNLKASYRTGYHYRTDLAESLKQIKDENPQSRFIAFSTPVSKLYFCAMVDEGKLPDYKRWLREMVGVYGEVWSFQDLNSVTIDYHKNYSDSHHYYPYVGTMVAHRITGVSDSSIPADFGVLVNRQNIDQYLEKVEADSRNFCK
jgi:hypothetical protein